jgi:hypothetical protein
MKIEMKTQLHHFALVLFGYWAIALLIAPPVLGLSPRMWLDPETLNLAPGDVATVDIHVEDVVELAGVEVHLTFDPALLEVVDADPSSEGMQIAHGDFLSADFVVQNVADPAKGTVDYAIAPMQLDKAASGSGILARITFRALAEGETRIEISGALLADTEGRPIAVETGSSVAVISRPGPSAGVWALIGLVAAAVVAGFIAVAWTTIQER